MRTSSFTAGGVLRAKRSRLAREHLLGGRDDRFEVRRLCRLARRGELFRRQLGFEPVELRPRGDEVEGREAWTAEDERQELSALALLVFSCKQHPYASQSEE